MYRLGVGLILVGPSKKVFIGKRFQTNLYLSSSSKKWQFPQGGIDKNETEEQALFREMEEEIGTRKGKIIAKSQNLLSYDFPPNIRTGLWNEKYKGQSQRWFLMEFEGNDEDINLTLHEQEFEIWKWENFFEVKSLVIDFKQNFYESIENEFRWYFDPKKYL